MIPIKLIKLVPWDKKTKLSKLNPNTKKFEEEWVSIPVGLSVSEMETEL